MDYRRLGNAGVKVSALSFGSWVTFGSQVDTDAAADCMAAAYDAGCNFFDNAETYTHGRSEEVMGVALKKLGWDRDSYLLSSKAFFGRKNDPKPTQRGLSRKHLVEACDQALGRLQVDYLDLFFCHRPDDETPVAETVRAMNELIQRGKVFYWGTSGYIELIRRGGGLESILPHAGILAGVGVATLVIGASALRRRVGRGETA